MKTLSWIKLAAAGLALVVIVILYGRLRSLEADRELLTAQLAQSSRLAAALSLAQAQSRAALAERETEARRLALEKDELLNDLEKFYALDNEAGAWADADLPGGIIERLRR